MQQMFRLGLMKVKQMNKEYEKWIEQLKNGEITKEQLFNLMTDDKGVFRLKKGKVTKTSKDKKKVYFGGTIVGYKDEIEAPFNFLPGSHEEATPHFAKVPYLLFHNDDMIPIGKVVEAWFDKDVVKYTAWSHDEKYNDAIIDNMMDSQSMGFYPIEYDFNLETWEFDIETYKPVEISGVVFPAYVGAKTEAIADSLEEVKDIMTEESTELSDGTSTIQLEDIPHITTTSNDHYIVTTTTSGTDEQSFSISVPEGVDEELEKLKKENKILKFLAKHPKMINREFVLEMMEKYNLDDDDAAKLVEEEEVIEEEVEETETQIENPPLPKQNEPIPDEDKDKQAIIDELDERIEDSRKRGFGN